MKELLQNAQHIVIFTHMAPDGDAMGSALALWNWLNVPEAQLNAAEPQCKRAGSVSVHVIVPNAFPAFFNWMPGADKIHVYEKEHTACDILIAAADLFICTDFNDPKRIGPMTDFADEVHSHPEASSSCEIVYKLLFGDQSAISNQQSAISNEVATCIYTGLMTDTGNFSFNSTRAELYDIIAELLRAGVQKDAIYDAVFNQYSEHRVRLTGYALYRKMRIYPEHHLALITLSADELEQYHYQVGDTEGLVNMPLQISDVYYSVFMREERAKPGTPKSRIRISFRSQGDRPVNIWASEVFHGGGHANASGGEIFGTIGQAVALFERTYKKYLKI